MLRLDRDGQELAIEYMDMARRMACARWTRAKEMEKDDLVGAAWLGLCRAASSWKGRCPFAFFAAQAVDCYLGREVARFRRRPDRFRDGDEELIEAPAAVEDDDRVFDALARLPGRDREFLYRIAGGDSYVDVGRDLGMSKGSACSAFRTARRRFRKILATPA